MRELSRTWDGRGEVFLLCARADSPLDFDLQLARKQSDENPVYYVQYAHARIVERDGFCGG